MRSGVFCNHTPGFGHNIVGKSRGDTCYNLFFAISERPFVCCFAFPASLTIVAVMGRDVIGTDAADFRFVDDDAL